MTVNLVPATTADISSVFALAEKIWNHHYVPIIGQEQVDYMLSRMYSKESLTEQMMEKNHAFYFIEKDGTKIGFISISGEKELWIHKFYIDQDIQGQGFGTQTFQKIKDLRPEAKSYWLTVNRKNYKSINFYFKNGFVIDHIDDFDIGDGYWMNDFIMTYKNNSL